MKEALLRHLFAVISRDICESDITTSGLPIPTRHGVNKFRELCTIPLINAAGIYPEILKSTGCSLVRAELYLPPPRLALAGTRLNILKADLFVIIC